MATESQMSRTRLLKSAAVKYGSALVIVGVLLFVPAGSVRYWNAWLYIASLFVPILLVGTYLYVKDTSLLEKRLKGNEKEQEQKLYVALSFGVFLIAFTMPGLDYRFKWSPVPLQVVAVAWAFMLIGYGLFVAVLVQNSYASRVVEIQEEQKLIDTGLYSVVRHPMYLASTILFLATPLVLGSYYSLIPMLFYPVMLAFRIKNEERVLKTGLKGYEEYARKVRYRMIPYVW